MRARGAGCPAGLLAIGWLILVGLQASQASNVTSSGGGVQEPAVAREGESESESESEEEAENEGEVPESETTAEADAEEEVQNRTIVKEVEFGMCTVTCDVQRWEIFSGSSRCIPTLFWQPRQEIGLFVIDNYKYCGSLACVGIREVILTNGCPGGESKCVVRVEECRGPVDCGWGKPISENLDSARLSCVHISPENRFKYVWKLLKPDQQPVILTNDSAVLEITREIRPLAFECDTLDNNEMVASVKFTVYTTNELQMRRSSRPDTDAVLVFVLTIGVIICIFVIFVLIFIIINWAAVKSFWGSKTSATEIQSELSSMRYKDSTSLDQSPTDIPVHEDDALSEWNE